MKFSIGGKKYKGTIDRLDKIVISDPSYNEDVGCRYEKNFTNKCNLDVELNINEVDNIIRYQKEKYHLRGIEFSILIKNPQNEDITINSNNDISYNDNLHIKKYEIGVDTACVALGINEKASEIINSRDEWQPSCSIKTLSDGLFGDVKEGIKDNEIEFIAIYGFLDEDTDYTMEDLESYLIENFEIKNLILGKELNEQQEIL